MQIEREDEIIQIDEKLPLLPLRDVVLFPHITVPLLVGRVASVNAIEEAVAIENLGEIVKVDGVDVLFIGSGDLSVSMGYPGEQDHPEVQRMMERGVKVILDGGKVAGVSGPDHTLPRYLEMGVQRVVLGTSAVEDADLVEEVLLNE